MKKVFLTDVLTNIEHERLKKLDVGHSVIRVFPVSWGRSNGHLDYYPANVTAIDHQTGRIQVGFHLDPHRYGWFYLHSGTSTEVLDFGWLVSESPPIEAIADEKVQHSLPPLHNND